MNRRNFMLAGLVGGTGGMLLAKGINAKENILASTICRSSRNYSIQVAERTPGELAYQGTHILTYGAFQMLAATYNTKAKGVIQVNGGGCDDGIAAVKLNAADLGGLCCPVEGTSAEGLPWLRVAWDIKTVVTHPSNPVNSLSLDELKSIAKGKISDWSELGGITQPIALVVRKHCPDKFEPVRQLLMNGGQIWSRQSLWVETDQQLIDTVARFPGAIGVVSNVFSRPLLISQKLQSINIDGAPPTREAVIDKTYPLKGPLNLVFKQERIKAISPFMDYLYSPEGEKIISKLLVPLKREESSEYYKLLA